MFYYNSPKYKNSFHNVCELFEVCNEDRVFMWQEVWVFNIP